MFLTFFSAQARVLFWFHGVLFCASSFWPIICSCISLARSLTQFLDSLSLPLPDCVLRSAYYGLGRGKRRGGEWPLWEMGKGFIAGLWLLCFLRFFVLFLVLLLLQKSAAAAACLYYPFRSCCCCCSFVLGFGLTLLTLIPKERRHLGDFSLPFLLQRFI